MYITLKFRQAKDVYNNNSLITGGGLTASFFLLIKISYQPEQLNHVIKHLFSRTKLANSGKVRTFVMCFS